MELEVTCNSLKPIKCLWYLIGFKFNKGKCAYEEAAQKLENIYVRDEFGWKMAMDEHPVRIANEVVCLWKSPTWSVNKQLEVITVWRNVTNVLVLLQMNASLIRVCGRVSGCNWGISQIWDWHACLQPGGNRTPYTAVHLPVQNSVKYGL